MTDIGAGWDLGAKLDAWVELGRGIKNGIDRLNDRWKARPEVITQWEPHAGTSPSSGDFLIELGGPALGRRRLVRQVIVGGSLFSSAPAGTAYLARGGATMPLVVPMANVVDFTTGSFPQRAFYGRGEMVLEQQEKLWCLIHSPTATTQYVVNVWFEDYELGHDLAAVAP